MVHRRLLLDDGYGVNEALMEDAFGTGLVAGGRHLVHLGTRSSGPKWRRLKAQEMYLQPTLFFVPTTMTTSGWISVPNKVKAGDDDTVPMQEHQTSSSSLDPIGIRRDLPENVNILTLETWNDNGDVLIRLEHLFEPSEDPILSLPVTVDLIGLFGQDPVGLVEMTLGGNQERTQASRFHWHTPDWGPDHEPRHSMRHSARQNEWQIELEPQEIRTFLLSF